jgi:hypothetical protein
VVDEKKWCLPDDDPGKYTANVNLFKPSPDGVPKYARGLVGNVIASEKHHLGLVDAEAKDPTLEMYGSFDSSNKHEQPMHFKWGALEWTTTSLDEKANAFCKPEKWVNEEESCTGPDSDGKTYTGGIGKRIIGPNGVIDPKVPPQNVSDIPYISAEMFHLKPMY